MRLCIVTHNLKKGDGQGRVNYEVAKEAIRRGHNLTLLATELAPELEKSEQVNWVQIPVSKYPTAFLQNLIFSKKKVPIGCKNIVQKLI